MREAETSPPSRARIPADPPRRVRLLLVPVLLLLGLLLRWRDMDRPFLGLHSMRECDTAAVARGFHERGIDLLHPVKWWDLEERPFRDLAELPLFPALEAAVHDAAGFRESNGRILNVLLSLLALFLFFLLVERWSGTWIALAALLALDLSPLHVYFSSAVTRHGGMEQSFLVGSLLLWDLWAQTGRRRFLLPWALVFGTGLCLTPPTALLAPVHLGAALLRGRRRELLRPWVPAAGLLALLLPVLWFAWVTREAGGFPANMYQPKGNLRAWTSPEYWVRWLDPAWFRAMGTAALLTVGTWGGLFLAAGALLLRRPRAWLEPPALWTFSAVLYFMADSYVVSGFFHHYYFLLWAPPLCWLAGTGLVRLAGLFPARAALPALGILALLYGGEGLLEGLPRARGWYRAAPCRVVDLFGWEGLVKGEDKVAFVNLTNDVVQRSGRKGWLLFLESSADEPRLARVLEQGAAWVLVGRKGRAGETPGGLEKILGPEGLRKLNLERVRPKGPGAALLEGRFELWRVRH